MTLRLLPFLHCRLAFFVCYNKGMATYVIILRTREGGDGIRALRQALKVLWRRFGLRALKVEQTTDTD
jgi:hypothetical protein